MTQTIEQNEAIADHHKEQEKLHNHLADLIDQKENLQRELLRIENDIAETEIELGIHEV